MQFDLVSSDPLRLRTGCLVVGVQASKKLSPTAQAVDAASGGALTAALKSGDHSGSHGQTLLLRELPGISAKRVLLVGCGKPEKLDAGRYQAVVRAAWTALKGLGGSDAVLCLGELDVQQRSPAERVQLAVRALGDAAYRFTGHAPKGSKAPKLRRLRLHLEGDRAALAEGQQALAQARALVAGMDLARDLGNRAGNLCYPEYLAERALELAAEHDVIKTEVLDEKAMRKLGMGALLAVGQGSARPPRLILMRYQGSDDAPLVLVGKGITFDTGGISLKPGAAMDEMKYDMCGAASVFGVMRALAELKPALNVVGVVAAAENMPDGNATRPGDVVTTLSGQTVEILNTDAEGRLVLCDALTYVERLKPQAVVDIATLTGACIVALGSAASGLMSNDDALAHELLGAGTRTWDRAWQLPLWDDYADLLKSNFADIPNIAGREAGTITAGCFLAKFARKYRWAHLDIAGTAWKSGRQKGATGRPVPLLLDFVLGRAP